MRNVYMAYFNRSQTTLHADSLYEAKQTAIAYFRPRKSQQHMVSVVLIEKDGKDVHAFNSNADFG